MPVISRQRKPPLLETLSLSLSAALRTMAGTVSHDRAGRLFKKRFALERRRS